MTKSSPEQVASVSGTGVSVGDVLGGKYRIDGQLGAGGMGVVLSATHLELDAPVAIKVVRDELARNEEVVSRMLFEARAAARLRSSHVVRVLDVARLDSGAPYIVMERLEGSDLATVLVQQRTLPVEEAVDYLLEACEGLAEAHALGIVHRDLKPENLFRAQTPEGFVVKVLDFGISKDTGPVSKLSPRSVMTNAGFAVGSPYYMSPEQMRASLQVDARADVWSLGAILFELLSGRCPFEGESIPLVCAKVLDEDYPSLCALAPQVPEELEAVVNRCLRKAREERFDSVAQLATALRPFASEAGRRSVDRAQRSPSGIQFRSERASAMPTPPPASATIVIPEPMDRPRAPRWWPVAALALVLAAAASGFAFSGSRAAVTPNAAGAPVAAPTIEAAKPAPVSEPEPVAVPQEASRPAPSSNRKSAPRTTPSKPAAAPEAVNAAAPAKSAAPVAAPRVSADAWDPNRLGGRY